MIFFFFVYTAVRSVDTFYRCSDWQFLLDTKRWWSFRWPPLSGQFDGQFNICNGTVGGNVLDARLTFLRSFRRVAFFDQ